MRISGEFKSSPMKKFIRNPVSLRIPLLTRNPGNVVLFIFIGLS